MWLRGQLPSFAPATVVWGKLVENLEMGQWVVLGEQRGIEEGVEVDVTFEHNGHHSLSRARTTCWQQLRESRGYLNQHRLRHIFWFNDGIQSLHRLNYHHSLAVLNPVKE